MLEDDVTDKRCAVCRATDERSLLLRFVRSNDGELLWDARRRAPGRGVSVCPTLACLGKLRPGLPAVAALGECKPLDLAQLAESIGRDVCERLGLLMRQRVLTVGAEPTIEAVRKQRLAFVFVANDVAEKTVTGVRLAHTQAVAARPQTAKVDSPLVFLPCAMQRLGRALGRDSVGVISLAVGATAPAHRDVLAVRGQLWCELERDRFQRMGDGENG